MQRSARLSSDGLHRYRLRREFGPVPAVDGLVIVGLNPSRADGERDDPTVRRLVGFARREDFGAFTLVNLFTRITPDPSVLRALPLEQRIDAAGDLETQVLIAGAGEVWLMFGAIAFDEIERAEEIVSLAQSAAGAGRTRCFGVTKRGWPRHPVRLANGTPLEPWTWPQLPYRRTLAVRGSGFRKARP
jgi:hypothetical protein